MTILFITDDFLIIVVFAWSLTANNICLVDTAMTISGEACSQFLRARHVGSARQSSLSKTIDLEVNC